MKSKVDYYSKEELQELYDNSSSYTEVLNKIGLSGSGSSSRTKLYEREKELGLSTDKLYENRENSRKKQLGKISNDSSNGTEQILTRNSKFRTRTARRRILRDNLIEYQCSICSNTGEWQGKELSLQLDHINGDNTDNRVENLRFLCPNCHTQTETYGPKKLKKKHGECKICGKPLYKYNKSGFCRYHVYINNKKKDTGNNKKKNTENKKEVIEQRKEFLDSIDKTKFGWVKEVQKEWGVSHTQVKRWIRKNYPEMIYYERK